jgi:hypothetical protein
MTSRTYDDILNDATALIRESESDNLIRYWRFGALVAEFCKGADRAAYGDRTIQTLASDLQSRGILSEIKDPTRHLYWSKSIHDTYRLPELKALAKEGYTVYHAKIMLSLDPAERVAIETDLKDGDGKIVSGRKLQELVKEKYRQQVSDTLKAAVATPAEMLEQKLDFSDKPAAPPATVGYSSATDPDVPESEGGPTAEERERILAERAAKPSKADKPAKLAKSEKTSSSKSDAPAESPLKVLNQLDKVAVKLMASIPDAFIAIREAGKRGFDSDKAAANYATKLKDVRTALASLQEPIQKLLETINDEAGSD